jgi:succinate dehydrogenase/fumarate reductase flavoprotein subunit
MPADVVMETDVLVVGGGMAGLFAAIKAREQGAQVVLVDKNYVSRSGSTAFAEGDYSLFNPDWGHDLGAWMDRVALAGEYVNDPEWTEITIRESSERYEDLAAWGIKVKEEDDGSVLRYGRPFGFGPLECCFLGRGWTFLPKLRLRAVQVGVVIVDRVMITDLLHVDGVIAGAVGFHVRTGGFEEFRARATVLCTGNGTFRNVPGAMGPVGHLSFDGEVMAYRNGASISGMEYCSTGAGCWLADKDEAGKVDLRGRTVDATPAKYPGWVSYGPLISFTNSYVDAEGYQTHRMVAANTIHEGRGPITYDLDAVSTQDLEATLRDIKDSKTEFRLERVGMDLTKGGLFKGVLRLESAPLHLLFGGGGGITSTGTSCTTDLPGLFAAGDVYHSKAVGAGYPAFGFGLRNASVTGARAGRFAAQFALNTTRPEADRRAVERLREAVYAPINRVGGFGADWLEQQLYNLMVPYYVLLVKHGDRLAAALTMVEFLESHIVPKLVAKDAHQLRLAHETKNRVTSIEMMLRSSLFRSESRGIHYREDFPVRSEPDWLAHVNVKRGDMGMQLSREPLPRSWWPDLSQPYRERYPRKFPGEGDDGHAH